MCQSSAPAPQSQKVSGLPDWAEPYAKDTLAKTAALTDISKNPYQTYSGERIAGLQPLQQKAFDTTAGLDAGPQAFQQQIGSYMSPYMQNVVDIEKREAGRQSDIMGTQQQAQATQAGAFGGGRDAIMRAERERNLSQQMGDIQAKGSQAAFEQGANQFRQGITQQAGLAQLQGTMGAQQQQQAQRPMDVAYQDFINQQNYPYKQIGFMSDAIRGLPLGQKSTQTLYDQGPGITQTLAGLGGAAYGFGKSGMFGAEGGLMESYAGGGVTSPQNVESILPKLSDQQLARAKEAALNRRDVQEAQMIDAEMAERASIRGGLGGAFNQIPEGQQEQMMADGGIVAFAKGGGAYGKKFEESMQTLNDLSEQQPAPQTPEELEQGATNRLPMIQRMMGEDVTQPYLEETKAKRAGLTDQFDKDKWGAFAAASLGMLARKRTPGESQSNQLISGLGEAGQAFIGEVGRLKKANLEADDKLRQSEILLATAQQQRKEGMANKAISSEEKAADQRQAAFKQKTEIREKVATLQGSMAGHEMQAETSKEVAQINAGSHLAAARINKEAGATADRQIAALAADLKRQNPDMSPAEINARATKEFLNLSGRYPGNVKEDIAQQTLDMKKVDAAEKVWKSAMMDPKDPIFKQIKQLNAADPTGAAAKDYKKRWVAEQAGGAGSSIPAPTDQPPPVNTGMPSRGGPQVSLPPAALSALKEGIVTDFANGQSWTIQNGKPVRVK